MKFNREVRPLEYYLTQVWEFMVQYEPNFPNDEARVRCITVVLEGEADNWLMVLHDADAEELYDFNFVVALRQLFEDPLADQRAKRRIKTIK